MSTLQQQSPANWTRADAKELRKLSKHLRYLNEVAGVLTPSGVVIDETSRRKFIALANKFSAAFGGHTGAWAHELAWGKKDGHLDTASAS